MELTYTYRLTPEAGGYTIQCLDVANIFTECATRAEAEEMATEVTELMLEDYLADPATMPQARKSRKLGKNDFQLSFDALTGQRLDTSTLAVL